MQDDVKAVERELREIVTCGCDEDRAAEIGRRAAEALATLQERCERLGEFVATIANGSAFRDQRFAEDDDAEYFLRVQGRVATLARTLTPESSGAYSMSPEDTDPMKLEGRDG